MLSGSFPHYIITISFAGVLEISTATATLHSGDTQVTAFPGFCFNSQEIKCPQMPGYTQLRTGGGGQPSLEATCLPPRVRLPVWAAPRLESDCPGLLLAFSGEGELPSTPSQVPQTTLFQLNLVTHPKIISQQQPLLWRAIPPPKSNLHPRLHLPKSRRVQGLLDPLLFLTLCLRGPYSALQVLVSCFLTLPP